MVRQGGIAASMKPIQNLNAMKPDQLLHGAYKTVKIDQTTDAEHRSFAGGNR